MTYSGGDFGVTTVYGGQINFIIEKSRYRNTTLEQIKEEYPYANWEWEYIKVDGIDAIGKRRPHNGTASVYLVKGMVGVPYNVRVSWDVKYDKNREEEFIRFFEEFLKRFDFTDVGP